MGCALLDLEEPWKVKMRSRYYLLAPEELYEQNGDVPNVVFPCAALTDAAKGRMEYILTIKNICQHKCITSERICIVEQNTGK